MKKTRTVQIGAVAAGLLLAAVSASWADDRPVSEWLGEGIARAEQAFVLIVAEPETQGPPIRGPGRVRRLIGCGVGLDRDGYLLTTWSVVRNARRVTVVPFSGSPVPGEVIGIDPLRDVAVVRVPPGSLPGARVGNSDSLETGSWVTLLGANYGKGPTASLGLVTGRLGPATEWGGVDVLRIYGPIRPGDSGGLVLNEIGEVVAVVSATLELVGGFENLPQMRFPILKRRSGPLSEYVDGIAIPINEAISTAWEVIERGPIQRGFLGVRIQPVTNRLAETLGLEAGLGAYVVAVVEGSPAAQTGIRAGDVILEIDGEPVRDLRQLHARVVETTPGQERRLTVLGTGERRDFPVQIGDFAGHLDHMSVGHSLDTGISPPQIDESRQDPLIDEIRILKARIQELERDLRERRQEVP